MSQSLSDFLAARLGLPTLAAWGARAAGSDFMSQSKHEWLTVARLEQTHQELAMAVERFGRYSLQPQRLCWIFEHVRIYFAARRDGASLACYVQNAPEIPLSDIEKALDDFLALNVEG